MKRSANENNNGYIDMDQNPKKNIENNNQNPKKNDIEIEINQNNQNSKNDIEINEAVQPKLPPPTNFTKAMLDFSKAGEGSKESFEERMKIVNTTVDECIRRYSMRKINTGIKKIFAIPGYLMGGQPPSERYANNMTECHEEIANLLFKGAQKYQGVALKACQYISIRNDMEEPYKRIFADAQDAVPIKSSLEYVEREVRGLYNNRILTYVEDPFKSASVAQVHYGTYDSKPVVVKVIHEGIRKNYKEDLEIMAEIGKKVDKYPIAKGAAVSLEAIRQALIITVSTELYLNKEAEMQSKARSNWEKDFKRVNILVPEVYGSTESVLVMERFNGVTIGDLIRSVRRGGLPGLDKYLEFIDSTRRDSIFQAYAIMALEHNIIHADPHPGNIMVLQNGLFGLLDWGQVIPVDIIREFIKSFSAIAPTSKAELANEEQMNILLDALGIKPEKSASATVEMLFCGATSTLFPHLSSLDSNLTSFVLILLYLSRLENMCVEIRTSAGLQDMADPFRVMRAFKKTLVNTNK